MGRRLVGFITVLLLAVALAPPAAAKLIRVIDTRATEIGFAQDDNGPRIRVWTGNSLRNPNGRVHYRRGTGPIRVLTDPRTDAFVPGLDLDNPRGELLTYAAKGLHGDSYDVRLYDLGGHHRVALPDGVNTNENEFHPTVSGNWLLFLREQPSGLDQVILFNLNGTDTRVLASGQASVLAGQVNGDWAVYQECDDVDPCVVHRYQISTGADVVAPRGSVGAHSPSVTTTGTVYYAIQSQGRRGLSGPDRIHRWDGTGSAPLVEALPNGVQAQLLWAFEKPGGGATVFFTRTVFYSLFRAGIYATSDTG